MLKTNIEELYMDMTKEEKSERFKLKAVKVHKGYYLYDKVDYVYPLKLKENEFVMLNSLDTNQYKKVPGIGSHYARRIAEYGRRLGGYVSTEQLREINGFPEESIRFFKLNATHIKKINLNVYKK